MTQLPTTPSASASLAPSGILSDAAIEGGGAWTWLPGRWRTWPFSTRFGLVAAFLLANSMFFIGSFIVDKMEHDVVQHAGVRLAYQVEALLEPGTNDLVQNNDLADASRAAIIQALRAGAADRNLLALKIWRADGVLVMDTLEGGPLAANGAPENRQLFDAARKGRVSSSFDEKTNESSLAMSASFGTPVLDVYAPLHSRLDGRVIAVAQLHQGGGELQKDILNVRLQSWVLVSLTGLSLFLVLYTLVHRGHGRIQQRSARLERQVVQQTRIARESEDLKLKLQAASRLGTELNERYLRRIGSDLHDGPAQHLALALLKMEDVSHFVATGQGPDKAAAERALGVIRQATSEAMREIRNISAGLSLPELSDLAPADAMLMAIRAHERATGSSVRTQFSDLPDNTPLPVTICIFRFVQEGLNNAFRHAGGKGQAVCASFDGNTLLVEVSDMGPGFDTRILGEASERLGLSGLKQRVEAIGGHFEVLSNPQQGTRLSARFDTGPSGELNA